MSDSMFWTNYRNTVVYTVVATAISIVLTTCYAYVLSKKHLKGRSVAGRRSPCSPCSSPAA